MGDVQVSQRVDLGISPVGFGCGANAGLMVSGSDTLRRETITTALERGFRFFDTAPAYGHGASERNLGATLAELRARDVDVYSKVLISDGELSNVGAAVVASVRRSLERLRLERLAGVTLHNRVTHVRDPHRRVGPGPVLSVDDVLGRGGVAEALERLRQDGVVDVVGFTAVGGDHGAIDAVATSGRFDFINAVYGVLRPVDRVLPEVDGSADIDLIDRAGVLGLGVIGLRVFGGGLLFDPAAAQAPLVGALSDWCRHDAMPLPALALRYALSRPEITAVVLGFTHPKHVDDAAEALAAGPLSPRQLEELATLQHSAMRGHHN